MAKVKMTLELDIVNRDPYKLADMSDVPKKVLDALTDNFMAAYANTSWIVRSVKISDVANKKLGIFWRKE